MTDDIKVEIRSKSDPDKTYIVGQNSAGTLYCSCPHNRFRGKTCKHMQEALNTGKFVKTNRYPRKNFESLAMKISQALAGFDVRMDFCGSYRRMKDTCKDLDIICAGPDTAKVFDKLAEMAEEVIMRGEKKIAVKIFHMDDWHTGLGGKEDPRFAESIQVDCSVVDLETYGAALCHATGSKEENIRLRAIAKAKGMELNQYGLTSGESLVAGKTEESIYVALGEPFKKPEDR